MSQCCARERSNRADVLRVSTRVCGVIPAVAHHPGIPLFGYVYALNPPFWKSALVWLHPKIIMIFQGFPLVTEAPSASQINHKFWVQSQMELE